MLLVILSAPDVIRSAAPFFMQPDSDPAQHFIGARYFLADVWRWPLLTLPDLGTPQGSNLTMTDSIPLLALIAKLLRPLFGPMPNYFGAWLLLCAALQAAGFAAIARALGVHDRWSLVGIGLLGVFSPALLFRTGHIALCSHFALLFLLASYWRYSRTANAALPFFGVAAWLAAGLLIHPYLAAMQLAIASALLGSGLWQQRLDVGRALVVLCGWIGTLLLVGWICGSAGVALPWGSYGVAPLDLAAPWNPQLSGLFAPHRLVDPTGYHYDAYNYWGAGFLLAAIVALVLRVRRSRVVVDGDIDHHPVGRHGLDLPLAFVLWLLTVYAVGYDVHLFGDPLAGVRAADVIAGFNRDDGIASVVALMNAHAVALGLLVAVALLPIMVLLIVAWRSRRHAWLGFVAIVALASLLLLTIAPERSLRTISNFAASGRFFWVVTYALVPLAIVACHRRLGRRAFLALLAVVALLQILDVRPLLERQRAQFAAANPTLLQTDALTPYLAGAGRVDIHPRFGCVKNAFTVLRETEWPRISSIYMALHWRIAERTLPTNSVYQARADDRRGCDAAYANGLPPPAGGDVLTIYVDVPGFPPSASWPGGAPGDGIACHPLAFGRFCVAAR